VFGLVWFGLVWFGLVWFGLVVWGRGFSSSVASDAAYMKIVAVLLTEYHSALAKKKIEAVLLTFWMLLSKYNFLFKKAYSQRVKSENL